MANARTRGWTFRAQPTRLSLPFLFLRFLRWRVAKGLFSPEGRGTVGVKRVGEGRGGGREESISAKSNLSLPYLPIFRSMPDIRNMVRPRYSRSIDRRWLVAGYHLPSISTLFRELSVLSFSLVFFNQNFKFFKLFSRLDYRGDVSKCVIDAGILIFKLSVTKYVRE